MNATRFFGMVAPIMVTAWVGGMWAIGYIAAPELFSHLTNKQQAGNLAGLMFTAVAWVGIVCGIFLLLERLVRFGSSALKQVFFWTALVMWLMTLGSHFGIQPIIDALKTAALPKAVMQSAFSDRFARWHGIASVIYLIESVLGLVLVSKV